MRAEYGQWNSEARIHAVGYDGRWLCGGKGITASECSDHLSDVTCQHCLKKLPEYLLKKAVPAFRLKELDDSLKSAEAMANVAEGKEGTCAIEGMPTGVATYLKSWIIPAIRDLIEHFEKP